MSDKVFIPSKQGSLPNKVKKRIVVLQNAKSKHYNDSKEPAPWKWFPDDPNNPYKVTLQLIRQLYIRVLAEAVCMVQHSFCLSLCTHAFDHHMIMFDLSLQAWFNLFV